MTGKWGIRIAGLPDKVAQVLEFDGEVDAVDDHVFGDVEHGRGEIEDGLDPGGDHLINHALSAVGGHG